MLEVKPFNPIYRTLFEGELFELELYLLNASRFDPCYPICTGRNYIMSIHELQPILRNNKIGVRYLFHIVNVWNLPFHPTFVRNKVVTLRAWWKIETYTILVPLTPWLIFCLWYESPLKNHGYCICFHFFVSLSMCVTSFQVKSSGKRRYFFLQNVVYQMRKNKLNLSKSVNFFQTAINNSSRFYHIRPEHSLKKISLGKTKSICPVLSSRDINSYLVY